MVSSTLCGAFASARKRGLGCTSLLCPTDCTESSVVHKEIRFQLPGSSACPSGCCNRPTRRADGRQVRVVLRPVAASALSGPLRFIVDSGSSHVGSSHFGSSKLGSSPLAQAMVTQAILTQVILTQAFSAQAMLAQAFLTSHFDSSHFDSSHIDSGHIDSGHFDSNHFGSSHIGSTDLG